MATRRVSNSSIGDSADPGNIGYGCTDMVGDGSTQPLLADVSDQLGTVVGHDDDAEWSSGVFDGCVQDSSWLV